MLKCNLSIKIDPFHVPKGLDPRNDTNIPNNFNALEDSAHEKMQPPRMPSTIRPNLRDSGRFIFQVHNVVGICGHAPVMHGLSRWEIDTLPVHGNVLPEVSLTSFRLLVCRYLYIFHMRLPTKFFIRRGRVG